MHTTNPRHTDQLFEVHPLSESEKVLDFYKKMDVWLHHLQYILKRQLQSTDLLFPKFVVKKGRPVLQPGTEFTSTEINAMFHSIAQSAGLYKDRATNVKFTTHCFRRGGAQYRFMFAEQKWSLKAIKWWGGWSENERVCVRRLTLFRTNKKVKLEFAGNNTYHNQYNTDGYYHEIFVG